jgi:hypothetical protein
MTARPADSAPFPGIQRFFNRGNLHLERVRIRFCVTFPQLPHRLVQSMNVRLDGPDRFIQRDGKFPKLVVRPNAV